MSDPRERLLGKVVALVPPNSPILRARARELTDRERAHEANGLIERLFVTMRAHNGAGLAAPQIGDSRRVFVMGNDSFVNPVIIRRSADTDVQDEGCLSLPGIRVAVRRNVTVTVQAAGRIVELLGMPARIAQHEIDHLDGVLITDRAVIQ
jgi:peptide deformylase